VKRILLSALVLLLLLGWTLPTYAAQGPGAAVTVAALNVRQGPGTNYPIISALHSGDTVTVTGRDAAGGWYQVALANGQTGWISAAYAQLAGTAGSLPVVAAPTAPGKSATAAPLASSGGGGVIVFQNASGGDIYVVNANPQGAFGSGTGLRRLTSGMDPVLSPDGRTVAFARWDHSSPGAQGTLRLINIDGTNERVLASDVHQPKSPTWSPDGTQIAFNMQQGGTLDNIRKCVGFNGGRPNIPPDATDIEISGGQICFTLLANPYWGLRLVNVADGTWRDLPRDLHSFTPAWDPANPWHLVFHAAQGLQSLDINQGTTWPINNSVTARSPVFSPDGKKLAVSFRQGDHWEIHVMNADGSGEVRLTETSPTDIAQQILAGQTPRSANNAAPSWSPDGSQIAFLTDRTGRWEIWVMNADGSGQRPLFPAGTLNGITLQYNGVDERMLSWR
jgi:dipeptidyl aminopeptidase/acylaminoacyl peptidase